MRIGIMQPYFLPYIGYFQLINAVDIYVIYDDVQFIKGGWINRNNILVNHQKFMFNLLMNGSSSNKKINEISVDANQTKLFKTIQNNYRKAPYYLPVLAILEKIFSNKEKNLAQFIANSIFEISTYLEIDTKFFLSSELPKNDELIAQSKIIHICKNLGATHYINAIGGKNLYLESDFSDNGICLYFLKTNEIVYKQFDDNYIPNLSILDVLMFNSISEIKDMLNNYELIQ